MSSATDFFGGGGVYPTVRPDLSYTPPALTSGVDVTRGDIIAGFNDSADGFFQVPGTATDTFDYIAHDGTDIIDGVWPNMTVADAGGSGTLWVSFFLLTSGLMYILTRDGVTTNYYLSTVDILGVVTPIGGAIVITNSTSAVADWGVFAQSAGSTSMYRETDGSGNLFLRTQEAINSNEAEINITTGALISDRVVVTNATATYKTPAGTFIGGFDLAGMSDISVEVGLGAKAAKFLLPMATGFCSSSVGLRALQWDGSIVMVAHDGSLRTGPAAYLVVEFDAAVDALGLLV